MFTFGYNPGDKVLLKDGTIAKVIYNVVGTTTFRLEVTENGERKIITRDRSEFKLIRY